MAAAVRRAGSSQASERRNLRAGDSPGLALAEPLSLKRATRERCLWARGRAPHVALLYRAAQATNPHPLETATVVGVRVTTRPALLRWLGRLNQGGRPEVPKPREEEQRRAAVERRLDALGLN